MHLVSFSVQYLNKIEVFDMVLQYPTMISPFKINPPNTIKISSFNKKTVNHPLITLSCFNAAAKRTNNAESIDRSKITRMDTEVLRAQIDQLQAEFEATQSKANNARMRLMRLSEAAESLQKRAANSIVVGKEIEARELLIQKKKLMKALEKSKSRVDVLDKLAMKINEAISVKESQLIGNVSLYSDFTQEETDPQIHFVDPKVDLDEHSNITDYLGKTNIGLDQNSDIETEVSTENFLDASSVRKSHNDSQISSLKAIPSFEEFMLYIDGKLQNVESELEMVVRLTPLILSSEEIDEDTKLQQTTNLVNDIHGIRKRIASIINKHIDEKDS